MGPQYDPSKTAECATDVRLVSDSRSDSAIGAMIAPPVEQETVPPRRPQKVVPTDHNVTPPRRSARIAEMMAKKAAAHDEAAQQKQTTNTKMKNAKSATETITRESAANLRKRPAKPAVVTDNANVDQEGVQRKPPKEQRGLDKKGKPNEEEPDAWDEPVNGTEPESDRESDLEDLEELVIEATGENVVIPQGFQRADCQAIPAIGQMMGSHLIRVLQNKVPENIPRLAITGLAKSTSNEHKRLLQLVQTASAELQQLPAVSMLVELITRISNERTWRRSTLLKNMASLQGALALLPIYREAPPMLLRKDPIWQQSMRAATTKARQEMPRQPTPATWEQVKTVLGRETSTPLFCIIPLSWLTAARVGCLLRLSRGDVNINADRTLDVLFRRGKTVASRGPYTVHTGAIREKFLSRFTRFIESRRSWVFPTNVKVGDVKISLRRVESTLEARSLRRGSLQTLAKLDGMTTETLMLFSGHSSVKTLLRYLNWGLEANQEKFKMSKFSPCTPTQQVGSTTMAISAGTTRPHVVLAKNPVS